MSELRGRIRAASDPGASRGVIVPQRALQDAIRLLRVLVLKVLTLDGIIYIPGQYIELEVWLRLSEPERNRVQNSGTVRVAE